MRYYFESVYVYFVHKSFSCVFIHTCVHKTWGGWMTAINDITKLPHVSPVAYRTGSLGISQVAVIAWVSASAVWSFCGSVECWRSQTHQVWRVFWCPGICRCTASPWAFYPQPDFNHLNFNLFLIGILSHLVLDVLAVSGWERSPGSQRNADDVSGQQFVSSVPWFGLACALPLVGARVVQRSVPGPAAVLWVELLSCGSSGRRANLCWFAGLCRVPSRAPWPRAAPVGARWRARQVCVPGRCCGWAGSIGCTQPWLRDRHGPLRVMLTGARCVGYVLNYNLWVFLPNAKCAWRSWGFSAGVQFAPLWCIDTALVLLDADCPGWPGQSRPAWNGDLGSRGRLSAGRGQSRALPTRGTPGGCGQNSGHFRNCSPWRGDFEGVQLL